MGMGWRWQGRNGGDRGLRRDKAGKNSDLGRPSGDFCLPLQQLPLHCTAGWLNLKVQATSFVLPIVLSTHTHTHALQVDGSPWPAAWKKAAHG
jgi:hypothetical protein